MEHLELRIHELNQENIWKPISLTCREAPLSHLLFADDVLTFCQASPNQVQIVASIVEELCLASARRYFLGISRSSRINKYLGTPMIQGRAKLFVFNHIMDQINGCVAAWKSRLLNKVGRLCLVQSVVTTIPIYVMQMLWLPQGICHAINQSSMIWSSSSNSKFWSMVGWPTIIKPKAHGGLGVRKARQINVSLIRKLVWDLIHSHRKPWMQIMRAKYLQRRCILQATKKAKDSYGWASILKVLPLLKEGFVVRLGSGISSLWYIIGWELMLFIQWYLMHILVILHLRLLTVGPIVLRAWMPSLDSYHKLVEMR
uniref:Ribonuclease H protein At1g65750 family n=1 Tax=Cajanus cajan TaxID=3821 RepID=A0A151RAB9_CAJCA|nr:Putative ribonuclease H protein At1g65750 family [Cajanus cajan]